MKRLRQWIGIQLDRIGLKRPVNHLRFSLTRPDWWVHQQNRRAFFSQWISKSTLCFDIGANDGRTAEFYLNLGAKVVAVEPQERCIVELKIRLDSRHGWDLVEAAVAAKPGRTTLHSVAEESQLSTMEPKWIESVVESKRFAAMTWSEREEVPVTTLDDLIVQWGTPDFCKIDVEGAEPAVLDGLSSALPILSFEYTPEFKGHIEQCLTRLSTLGDYKFNLALHDTWSFQFPEWQDHASFLGSLQSGDRILCGGGDVYAVLPDILEDIG